MSTKEANAAPPQTIDLIDVGQAQKHAEHRYDVGIMTGAIVAAGVTSNKAQTIRNFVFDIGVGALVGVGAILVGRAFDHMLKTKKEPVKGDIIHATLEPSPEQRSR